MRIAGVPVGSVKGVTLNPDNTVDVAFNLSQRYQLYTSTRAVVRYENLVGDRYLEIVSGPGDLKKVPPGGTLTNTQPALDLDALLGGLKPVFKGLDGNKINEVSNAIIELLQGQGGALSQMLSSTAAFTQNLSARDQLIGDVINDLNTVLGTVDEKGAQFDATVDRLQKLLTTRRGARPDRRRHRPSRLGHHRSHRDVAEEPAAAAGCARERPPARPAPRRA